VTHKLESFARYRITSQETRPIRHAVLRQDGSMAETIFSGDDDPDAFHAGVYDNGAIVAVASVFREAPHGEMDVDAWRLRGMAVLPGFQNRGYGKELLQACIAYVKDAEGSHLWCNARSAARNFYESAGFTVEGNRFYLPQGGNHYFMRLRLRETKLS